MSATHIRHTLHAETTLHGKKHCEEKKQDNWCEDRTPVLDKPIRNPSGDCQMWDWIKHIKNP